MTRRSFPRGVAFVLGAGLALGAAPGCKSRLTGNEGNLEFSYVAADDVTNFNKPIAVGAKLDVQVAEVGTHRPASLQTAETDDAGVLRVASFQGDTLVLEGAGSGQALVSVSAKKPNGDVVTDSVNMQARVPEVLVLNHSCTSDPEGLYLVDQDVSIHFELKMTNGQPVIGYGYYPVTADPADGLQSLNEASKKQEFMDFHTAADAGTVTLASQIDATTATLRLVAPAAVDGAELDGDEPDLLVGGLGRWLHVIPTVAGKRVCQARLEVQAHGETDELCEVRGGTVGDDLPTDSAEKWGFVFVKGLAKGKCRFSVTYPAAQGGAGYAETFELNVSELDRPE